MKTVRLLVAMLLATLAQPAFALRIVLTNDDGLTSNLAATYAALKADGHDVIVSVPCTGQSGRGAAIVMLSTTTIVADNDKQIATEGGCHNGAASTGAPAVGRFTKAGFDNGDYHYVHGTPVMATMYALDVLAPTRWGKEKAPDLVLSGPNEGQNVGHVVIHSGTVGNAQFAAGRGLPAIALSAGTDTVDNTALANPLSAVVARHAARLVKMLEDKAGKGPLLPPGLALNVNFPNKPTAELAWAFSRIGSFDLYDLRFRDAAPWGLSMSTRDVAGATRQQSKDEAVISTREISVSAMQAGFESTPAQQQWLNEWLTAPSKPRTGSKALAPAH